MICPACAEAVDKQKAEMPSWEIELLGGPLHGPRICRDHAIQPHGCTCQHGQRGQQPISQETP